MKVALRHTCGSWLALQGVHPNVIKTVMRHSTITLTMDTYGHLLPDQHAEAISGIASMMTGEIPLAATGTAGTEGAVQGAVGMRRKDQDGTTVCDPVRNAKDVGKRNPLRIAELCESVRDCATGRGGIRTHTPVTQEGILSPFWRFP